MRTRGAFSDQPEPREPEDHEPYVREVALFAGLACSSNRPLDAAVVDVLRDGIERVVSASMGIDLTWWTTAFTPDDDLTRASPNRTPEGLDWAHVAAREGNLESVSLTAITTAMRGYHWHPKYNPVTLGARFPMFVHWANKEVAGLTIGLAMHRWAMYGGGADLDRVVEPLTGWLLGAADALDADTGYITLDRVSADDGFSPWERAVGFSPGYRDVTDTVWGYGWGTLLGRSHVAALGGIQSLQRLPWARAEQRAGGRVWLTLTREISALDQDAMRPLREILAPVLPVGSRTYQEYLNSPPEPGVLPEVYLL